MVIKYLVISEEFVFLEASADDVVVVLKEFVKNLLTCLEVPEEDGPVIIEMGFQVAAIRKVHP